MVARLFAASCVAVALLIGGCSQPTSSETTVPQAAEAPVVSEAPAAVEATVTPEKPQVSEAPAVVQQKQTAKVIRVNCGAYEPYTDKDGNVWAADQEWAAGQAWGAEGGMTLDRGDLGITGTNAPRVYEFERYSMDAYKFTVPNGKYTVRLHFCETYEGIMGAGERVFSVSLQGKEILKNFDVFKDAGGSLKPLVKEYKEVSVDNGQLVIGFTYNIENPEINGIEIVPE